MFYLKVKEVTQRRKISDKIFRRLPLCLRVYRGYQIKQR